MKYKDLLINTIKYLLIFFVVNFTASFLYEYFTKGTTLAEFYGTFAFGYIFAFAAVVTALYRTKNKNNE
ncbi:MAG: hypothetical protein ACI9V1_003166 [Spirosomataceae bacterium]|jgi:hypothetical protein